MSETASVQLNRIGTVVAELSRREAEGRPALTIAQVANAHRTTPEQIQRDIRTLTQASDDPDTEWLQSVSIWQEGDRLSVSSRGPFRRPIRFTPDELMAIQVGLATEKGGAGALSRDLASLVLGGARGEPGVNVGLVPGGGEAAVADLARRAADEHRLLSILYVGGHDRIGRQRLVEPHQVLFAEGRAYVVAWCRASEGWRNFRADRVLDAILADGTFAPRADFQPFTDGQTVFRADAGDVDEVTVRFSPAIARWLVERYPDAVCRPDGSVEVTFRVAEPTWLVRHVLQYGPEAEVLGPPEYREAVERAVGRGVA
jgi:proteasome accessory factor C